MSLSALRETVLTRDRRCVASLLDRRHDECRDAWGNPHRPTDVTRLTLEHVKLNGRRIDHDLHCIALCSEANVHERWSSGFEHNALAQAYLDGVAAAQGRSRLA